MHQANFVLQRWSVWIQDCLLLITWAIDSKYLISLSHIRQKVNSLTVFLLPVFNAKADYLSRFKDFNDWKVVPEVFNSLDVMFGHTLWIADNVW